MPDSPLPTEPRQAVPSTAAGAEKTSPLIRYLAYPKLFVPDLAVGSLAALPDRLVASTVGPAAAKLVQIDAVGNVFPIPIDLGAPEDAVCPVALSPGYHPAFPEGELLVGVGAQILRLGLEPVAIAAVASLPGGEGDVAGLGFDQGGGFLYAPIVLSTQGGVFRLDSGGVLQRLGDMGPGGRGPCVAAASFGQHAGRVMVAFPASGDVRSLAPTGEVSRLTGWSGVSGVHTFPDSPREFATSAAALFVAVRNGSTGRIFRFSREEITGFPGSLLLTSLHASGSGLVTLVSGFYRQQSWSRSMGAELAAAFVQRTYLTRIDIDVVPGGADALPWDGTDPVPVALLSSPNFVPGNTDAGTVRAAGAAPVPLGKGTLGSFAELNGDATPDLVLYFRPAEMQLLPGAVQFVVEGATFTGEPLRGESLVNVLQP